MENDELNWKKVFKKILLKDTLSEEKQSTISTSTNDLKNTTLENPKLVFKDSSVEKQCLYPNSNTVKDLRNTEEKQTLVFKGNSELKGTLSEEKPCLISKSMNDLKNTPEKPKLFFKTTFSAVEKQCLCPNSDTTMDLRNTVEKQNLFLKGNSSYEKQCQSSNTSSESESFINEKFCETKIEFCMPDVNSKVYKNNIEHSRVENSPQIIPKWDNAFKQILGEKKQPIPCPESPMACAIKPNLQSKKYPNFKSCQSKRNVKPQKEKPKMKKELTEEEKKIEQIYALCFQFKPVVPKHTLNDFEGLGINVFKTQKPDVQIPANNIFENEYDDSFLNNSLSDHKRKKDVKSSISTVEWTKITAYTFKDAMAAKDKSVLTEEWELDDKYLSYTHVKKRFPLRKKKYC